MLWTICVILAVLWLLGMVSSYTMGGLLHVLLFLAVAIVLINLIQGRRTVSERAKRRGAADWSAPGGLEAGAEAALPSASLISARVLSGHPRDDGEQMGRIHGLRDVVLESGQERAPAVCGPGVGRQRSRRDEAAAARRQQTHTTDEREAVLSGHGDVTQEDVGLQAFDEIERLPRGSRGRDDHPVLLEDQSQGLARVLLVVDEQDREAVRRADPALTWFAGTRRGRRPRRGLPPAEAAP